MSKIQEGATHTYTVRGKKSYRRMAGDLWEVYIDGEWFGVMYPHAEDYVMIHDDFDSSRSGLPAIGGKFEAVLSNNGFMPKTLEGWKDGDVIECISHFEAQPGNISAVFFNKRLFAYSSLREDCYRPIRTSDQIAAAKERSIACDRIFGIITGPGVERKGNTSDMAEALYDAGLRFVEVTK